MRNATTGLFIMSLSFFMLSFTGTQQRYKVSVRINRLEALSTDACNKKMDFYAIIKLGDKTKRFPVMEGNDISPGWVLSGVFEKGKLPWSIMIMDEDDALCGGGDDVVVVSPDGYDLLKGTIEPSYRESKSYSYIGKPVGGKERGKISFTITSE